jgi:hypothetical protein
MVLQYIKRYYEFNKRCKKCGEQLSIMEKLCGQCQINYFKVNFTKWTSNNEQIDNFIQEMQLKSTKLNYNFTIFEWIPYDQFKEVSKSGFNTIYSAIWKNGPLSYRNWKKSPDTKVALRYYYNLQNIDEFLKEVTIFYKLLILYND